MTQHTPTTSASAPTEAAAISPPAVFDRALDINYRAVLRIWMTITQWVYILGIAWAVWVPESGKGILAFIARDYHINPGMLTLPFWVSIGMSLRGAKARYRYLGVLFGQGVYAVFTLHYVLRGEVSILSAASHVMLMLIYIMSAIAMAQDAHHRAARDHYPATPDLRVRGVSFLMPLLGIAMILYGMGIAVGGSGTTLGGSLNAEFGTHFKNGFAIIMCIAGGAIFFNHIPGHWLFIGILPQWVYSVFLLALLRGYPNVSLIGVLVNVAFSVTAGLIVLIQTQDYEGKG